MYNHEEEYKEKKTSNSIVMWVSIVWLIVFGLAKFIDPSIPLWFVLMPIEAILFGALIVLVLTLISFF